MNGPSESNPPTITFLEGRDIETLDRDELLTALRLAVTALESEREIRRMTTDMDSAYRAERRHVAHMVHVSRA